MAKCLIRQAQSEDKEAWSLLWRSYCRFYGKELSEEISEHTWQCILSPDSTIGAIVALDDAGKIVGFANYNLHPHTWSAKTVCYLEDLFVDESLRGGGIGRALIDKLLLKAKENDWVRLYWMTESTNEAARRLYDTYVQSDGFVRYVVATDPDGSF